MISTKLEKVFNTLAQHYVPFRGLSAERFAEAANLIRLIELHAGEIMQLRGGAQRDYLFVIEGHVDVIQPGSITSVAQPEQTRERPLLLPAAPATITLVAQTAAIVCHAESNALDRLASWDEVIFAASQRNDDVFSRLDLIRHSLVFRRLPVEAVEQAFERMRVVPATAGDEVIRHGQEADAYYVIARGRAEVYQQDLVEDGLLKVAELGPGDTFGSEALISGKTRNETVRMVEDGSLLVLSKDDFDELVRKPLVRTAPPSVAKTMIESGYRLLDVRHPMEYDEFRIPGATLVPLTELRERLGQLQRGERYLVYCHSGTRSAVAAMLLTTHQLDATSLEGGIMAWPYELYTAA